MIKEDARWSWTTFIETYTPTLVALIGQAGVRRHDEAMEIYVRVCEHLCADDCARLRRHDPAKGPLAAWLTVVVRRVIVDWVRSRQGRRRLFASIRALAEADQRVFELYYWHGHGPGEIAEIQGATLSDVFDALERIERALTDRQRAELLSMAARVRQPAQLEAALPDVAPDPERGLHARRLEGALAAALGQLPAEDALIVSMRYLDGLSRAQVERALRTGPIAEARMRAILDRLRVLLAEQGVAKEVA